MKHLTKAMLMILLIVTIPMYSASVYAASVQINSIKGNDNIPGMRKKVDSTKIDVSAALEGDDSITSSQLRTWINGGGPYLLFNNCDSSGRCLSDRATIMQGGKYTYHVRLLKDNGDATGASASATIVVDDQKPVIRGFSTEAGLVRTDSIDIDYIIEDTAYTGGIQDCSGIKKLEIYKNDYGGEKLKEVNIDSSSCIAEDTATVTVPSGDGEMRICGKAYDKFEQPSAGLNCLTINVDKTAPQISGAGLMDLSGRAVRYIGINPISASLAVNITDNNLDINTVAAELNQFGFTGSMPGICQKIDQKYKCLWNFYLMVYDSVTPNILIKAKDNAGNELSTQATLDTITRDITGPKIESLTTTPGMLNGAYYIGRRLNITAAINDAVGVSDGNVYLDLSEIGLGDKTRADSCTKNTCIWEIDSVNIASKSKRTITSTLDSKDELGNMAAETKSLDIITDTEAPRIDAIEVDVAQGQVELPEGFAVKGDKLAIIANVSDNSTVRGSLISNIFGDVGVLQGDCQFQGNERYICRWETPVISISGPYSGKLFFSFTDFTGNTKGEERPIFVSMADDDTEPNYFRNEVHCSPSFIDRQVSEKLGMREHCHVRLIPEGVNAVPLVTELIECYGYDMDFVDNIEVSNNFYTSLNPVLTVDINPVNFEDNSNFNITCDLGITSNIGGTTININPEIESVNIKIPVYNFPLGEMSDQLEEDIKEAIDDAKGPFWDTIGILKKIMDYAGKLCYVVSAIANILSIFRDLQLIFSANSVFVSWNPLVAPAVETGRRTQAMGMESFRTTSKEEILTIAQKFCWFLNCQLGPKVITDKDPKYQQFFNFIGGGGGFGLQPRKWGDIPFVSPNWFEKWTGKAPESYLNGRDSAVIALLTLCVPGIINAIDRARQINCMYAICMESTLDSNTPPEVCDQQKDYLQCRWVVGEIFNAIPIAALFNYYIEAIKSALANPIEFLGIFVGYICAPVAATGPPFAYAWCVIPDLITLVGESIENFKTIFNFNFWKIQTDYCDQVSEIEFDEEEEE